MQSTGSPTKVSGLRALLCPTNRTAERSTVILLVCRSGCAALSPIQKASVSHRAGTIHLSLAGPTALQALLHASSTPA